MVNNMSARGGSASGGRKKILISIIFFTFFSITNFANAALLSPDTNKKISDQTTVAGTAQGGFDPTASVGSVVATIITAFLSLLGIIFVVLIIYAGFLWMTADGEEEKVNKAKSLIQRAIIGLVIIVAAYAITYFVFNTLLSSAGNTGNPAGSSG